MIDFICKLCYSWIMKKKLFDVLCVLSIVLLLSSCAADQPSSRSFEAMDTLMSLKVYGGAPDIGEKLQSRIESLDALLDATDANSEIARLNTEGSASVSEDAASLLDESLALCRDFDGAFDITVYPAVQAWGFTAGAYRVPSDDELKTLAANIDWRSVKKENDTYSLPEKVALDLGAVAKGYAADVSKALLDESHAQAAVLNLGGTICLCGQKPDGSRFSVGVADPENPAAFFGTLTCDKCVVATSGGYERYFEQDGKRYIHILDPKTAKPADNGVLSVTVVSDSGTFADAASTALFVMGLDKAAAYYRSRPDFDFILLTDDDTLYITEGIDDDFTLGDGYDFTIRRITKE